MLHHENADSSSKTNLIFQNLKILISNPYQKRMQQQQMAMQEEALLRMQMSQDFTRLFKRAYQIFSDPDLLIGKNMTPTTFWFFVDALYFKMEESNETEIQQIQNFLFDSQNCEFDEMEDLQFILKLRKLVSKEKMGTLNLEDIKSTSIDQVIEIAESHLQHLHQQNIQKLENCKKKQQEEKQNLFDQLSKFDVTFRNAHPMFYFEELGTYLRSKWTVESLKQQNKEKCYLCSHPNKLITCNVQKCHLKVHPTCYPTYTQRFDNKSTKPSEEQLKKFICENCLNSIDSENQKCELCCCIGGHFVKIADDQNCKKIGKIVVNKQNLSEDNRNFSLPLKQIKQCQDDGRSIHKKHRYAHLTCFIWNTELKWNIHNNQIEIFNRNVKKKLNGMCSFCGVSFGITIPCSNQTCRRFYHGQCAKRHNIEMNLIRAKTSIIQIYCQRHRHLSKSEAIQQSSNNKFKEIKKMFEGIDKEIKRLNVISSYQQVKLVAQRDNCTICGKQQGRQKITVCKQCRKWYHNACSSSCKNCS